jgi:hypothetical protein
MSVRPSPKQSLTVDEWLAEHEGIAASDTHREAGIGSTLETVLGGLFLVWGAALMILLFYDVVLGVFVVPFLPDLRGWWLASLGLAGLGSWLAFELSDEAGFEIREERSPDAGTEPK